MRMSLRNELFDYTPQQCVPLGHLSLFKWLSKYVTHRVHNSYREGDSFSFNVSDTRDERQT